MSGPRPSGTVERFDRIWNRWDDRSPVDKRVARHRTDRERSLQALEKAVERLPVEPC